MADIMEDEMYQLVIFRIDTQRNNTDKQKRNWENSFQRWSNKEFEQTNSYCLTQI